jgi:O-antigen/teichoic acid export membrane protein
VQSSAGAMRQSILNDGLYTFLLRTLNIGAALAVGVLTARILGPAGKGIYALPVIQSGLVATAFPGLASATSYFLLNGRAAGSIIRPLSIASLLFVAAGAVVVLIVAALSNALWAAPAAIASLPAAAMAMAVSGYVTGIKRIRYSSSLAILTTLCTLVLTAIGFLLVARTPSIAIVAWVVSTTLVAVCGWVAMVVHARRLGPGDPVEFARYMRLVLSVGATSVISLLNYRADLYLVAVFLPPFDLGLYSIATSAPQALLLPTQVAATVTSPHIGSLERVAAARLATRCVRNNMLMALVMCVFLFAFAPIIVRAFYGASFLPLVPSLRILLVGVVALSLGAPVSAYYTLKLAKPQVPLLFAGVSASICIALCFVLIPRFGIDGAAIASSAAYIGGQGFGLRYFTRDTSTSVRSLLVPTLDDLGVYYDFLRRLWRTGARFLIPSSAAGKRA